ncbi:hypothetical protein WA538_001597, partial [Blastocystis sp. DL]
MMDDIFLITDNNIIEGDPTMGKITAFARGGVQQCQNDKQYKFSKEESQMINKCQRARKMNTAMIAAAGGAVAIVGSLLSARKDLIIQNTVIITAIFAFQEWVESYGRCLLGLCQVPRSQLATEMRKRIFTDHGKSQTADYLHELGYDLKHLEEPVIEPIPTLREAKCVQLSEETASQDLILASYLRKMDNVFATDKPTIRKYDNMMSVTYTNASNQTHGSSFFIQGTLHDVVTMLRRVNQEYRLTEQFERGGLVRLKSALIRAGPIYSGEVIAVADPNTSAHLDNGMIATIPKAEKKVSRSEKRSMAKMEREEERHRREQIMMRRKPRSLKKHPETNTLPADKEQDVYHGTSIMPADKEERETYHGTSIMPADKEERETYHGTSIMPADNEEREVYHGTNIMPAEKEEKETYHGTLIAPEEMLYRQVAPESDSFDINDYMGAEDRWVEVTPQRRFKSFAQQHHEDLHRPPKEHVT